MELKLKTLNKDDVIMDVDENSFKDHLIKLGWSPPVNRGIYNLLYDEYVMIKDVKSILNFIKRGISVGYRREVLVKFIDEELKTLK